jgi:hypothetical protein
VAAAVGMEPRKLVALHQLHLRGKEVQVDLVLDLQQAMVRLEVVVELIPYQDQEVTV